jgi:hypothetical protein
MVVNPLNPNEVLAKEFSKNSSYASSEQQWYASNVVLASLLRAKN